jgi:hypothetical protein
LAATPRASAVYQPLLSFVSDDKDWDASAVPVVAPTYVLLCERFDVNSSMHSCDQLVIAIIINI